MLLSAAANEFLKIPNDAWILLSPIWGNHFNQIRSKTVGTQIQRAEAETQL